MRSAPKLVVFEPGSFSSRADPRFWGSFTKDAAHDSKCNANRFAQLLSIVVICFDVARLTTRILTLELVSRLFNPHVRSPSTHRCLEPRARAKPTYSFSLSRPHDRRMNRENEFDVVGMKQDTPHLLRSVKLYSFPHHLSDFMFLRCTSTTANPTFERALKKRWWSVP